MMMWSVIVTLRPKHHAVNHDAVRRDMDENITTNTTVVVVIARPESEGIDGKTRDETHQK